jgi:two-component system OmpR family sensor kinase
VTLRRRLVVTIVVLVAVGLVSVDVITLASLRSFLVGRVDSQLTSATQQVAGLVVRALNHDRPLNLGEIQSHVSPDVYVEIFDAKGDPLIVRPSRSGLADDPAPRLPHPLPVSPLSRNTDIDSPSLIYRPQASATTVGSVQRVAHGRHVSNGPQYRLLATSLPGQTLVVATRLDSASATLSSLRAIEVGLTIGLLVLLAVLIAVIVRRGLRPLEDMSAEADAIAEGDLTRRVHPDDGTTEISRLGRALNGMLAQIETAFAQRAGSEERLRSFLSDASHELRTPLTSIQGYAELLRKDALPDQAARDRALARIEQEAARMGLLVGDLAVLAREVEGPIPEPTQVDLDGVVAEVVSDARMIDGTRTIELDVSGPVPVLGDRGRLEQLVHNLVGNALSHTPAGTPVEIRVRAEGDQAVLVVRDHGPGMPPDQAERVFDRFYRAPSSSRDGGSGLGLFIVATLARGFGGRATVATAPGVGSAFTVVLPLDPTVRPVTGRTTHSASAATHRPSPSPGPSPTAGTTPTSATDDAPGSPARPGGPTGAASNRR